MTKNDDCSCAHRETAAPWQQQTEALLLAAGELNGASDPEQILLRVVSVAAHLLAVERVAIATNEGDHALRRYTWDDDGWQPAAERLPLDRTIAGWVIRHCRPYRSDDLSSDDLLDGGSRFKTLLAVPILGRDGRALGALNLHERRDGRLFSDADQRLAEGIAHHAAIALERAMMLAEIRIYVSALEAKTKEQESFLHTVSHALKTPLASIRAMSELLEDDKAAQSSDVQYGLSLIARNARRLQTIVDDLLALARADLGLRELEPEQVNLETVIEAARSELAAALKARDARLTIVGSFPRILGHAGRLTEVFANLIDNAVKYVPQERQPTITIGVRAGSGMVECWLTDNGIGIPTDQRESVFELFHRLDAAKQIAATGSGVGLTVVRRIVERYGGQVWIEGGEGGGISVHLTFIEYSDAYVARNGRLTGKSAFEPAAIAIA